MKNTNDNEKYKKGTSKRQGGNESFDNPETADTSRNKIVINTTKEEESLIKRLMSINFKHHVIKYVMDVFTLCREEII